ncbi:alanine racemase [Amphiplicatus metriothermophilus]|uniref:D-serine deaminase, pyridoxal phosphate-dependent n=1 Tax=Amphiplicatus metriothermophilus TaxID=1519374 RepID=A0A239PWC4_9PROT|nr:alanine racemase [Amphiplicatus metriothermophilus]MBB5519679.1 D-serine deaminase-like pyridoxal phosphate-dependent protein [Amphiplicatus metriothermophilus]SNT74242.1 D-serine deaminase, pyridoxal phosphate-dependent [Amphiplicatus metriothermophilus]
MADEPKALDRFETPQLVLDAVRLERNLARMKTRLARFGVPLRPHIKTAKSIEVYRPALEGAVGVAVSTLAEAEYAFEHGARNILYAVGMAPGKIGRALKLKDEGADIIVTVDSIDGAQALAARAGESGIGVVVEIDSDGVRAGVKPESEEALAIARRIDAAPGLVFRGLMTHAGGSYASRSVEDIRAMAERERRAVAGTATMLREAGLGCEIVSVGSTPTALFAERFDGVTEVRAGVYMFMDLVMAGLGVCAFEDIALSVLASVIGRQADRGRLIIDAGWMALSRDRGAAKQPVGQGYGVVCDAAGRPLDDLIVVSCSQEHGIVARRDGKPLDVQDYPVGTLLRILPNHACATAAQHGSYLVTGEDGRAFARWPRINGW